MTLDTYFGTADTTPTALAASIGVSDASMSRIRKGAQNISLDLANRIVLATGGKVTLEDLSMARQKAAA